MLDFLGIFLYIVKPYTKKFGQIAMEVDHFWNYVESVLYLDRFLLLVYHFTLLMDIRPF